LDALVNFPQKDQNGQKCSIIKVVTTESGFTWDGDQFGLVKVEKKTGEYWIYVPHGAKYLSIFNFRYGNVEYPYPEPIKKASVYELLIAVKTLNHESITGEMEILSDPSNVQFFINDTAVGFTPKIISRLPGKYKLSLAIDSIYTTDTITIERGVKTTKKYSLGKKEGIKFEEENPLSNLQKNKKYYDKHRFSIYYGYHPSFYSDIMGIVNIYNTEIDLTQKYGNSIKLNYTFYPYFINLAYVDSRFRDWDLRIYVQGIDFSINMYPIAVNNLFLPYFGIGCQTNRFRILTDSELGDYPNKEMSCFSITSNIGFKINYDGLLLFSEAMTTLCLNNKNLNSIQCTVGFGFNF
jgi:hypothetical protein